MSTFALRRATEKDLVAVTEADGRGFGRHYLESDLDDVLSWIDLDRFWLAVDPDDDAVLGVTASFDFAMTMPGGATLPVPGVTWVSVALTHRRRGILRALLAEQHRVPRILRLFRVPLVAVVREQALALEPVRSVRPPRPLLREVPPVALGDERDPEHDDPE